jgi:hypothetical protein
MAQRSSRYGWCAALPLRLTASVGAAIASMDKVVGRAPDFVIDDASNALPAQCSGGKQVRQVLRDVPADGGDSLGF